MAQCTPAYASAYEGGYHKQCSKPNGIQRCDTDLNKFPRKQSLDRMWLDFYEK